MAGMSFQSPHPINGTEPGLKVAQPVPGEPMINQLFRTVMLHKGSDLHLKAGGDTPANGVIMADFGGDALARDGVQIGCDGKEQSLTGTAAAGASCEFHNVDMVHGGSYSAFQSGDGHGTCKLEIFPE